MRNTKFMAALVFAALIGMFMAPSQASAQSNLIGVFDVSGNMNTFVSQQEPIDSNGFPAYGNVFIIEGYIYEGGTLGASNGILPDGSPEFPDQVIGKWWCRGFLVNDAFVTPTGPFAISTQTFSFGPVDGVDMISTEGFEMIDPGAKFNRAIIGGAGSFNGVRGVQVQETLGVNATGADNQRVKMYRNW